MTGDEAAAVLRPSPSGNVKSQEAVKRVEACKDDAADSNSKPRNESAMDERDENHHEARGRCDAKKRQHISSSPMGTMGFSGPTKAVVDPPNELDLKTSQAQIGPACCGLTNKCGKTAVGASNPGKEDSKEVYRKNEGTQQLTNGTEHKQSSLENQGSGVEEPPFGMFNHAFETLMEPDCKQADAFSLMSSSSPTHTENAGQCYSLSPEIDKITLPVLDPDDNEFLIGEFSPIKVDRLPSTAAAAAGPCFPAEIVVPRHSLERIRPTNTEYKSLETSHQVQLPNVNQNHCYNNVSNRNERPRGIASHVSNPFYVIRSCRKAFSMCTYVLPCVRGPESIAVNVSQYGHIHHFHGKAHLEPGVVELTVARRRVETAICAFGGSLNNGSKFYNSSIFRLKGNSSLKQRYEQRLPQRYRTGTNSISWDVEENPPVEIKHDTGGVVTHSIEATKDSPLVMYDDKTDKNSTAEMPGASVKGVDAQKMKYRCKLCGQPKQNHNCPYSQSLQRDIGVTVNAAVNAYTASEPGRLAPALSEMNNFVSYDNSNSEPSVQDHIGPNHLPKKRSYSLQPSTVTPLTTREGAMVDSPQSSLSTLSQGTSPNVPIHTDDLNVRYTAVRYDQDGAIRNPRHSEFAPFVQLRPEHYRAVTADLEDPMTAHRYPPVEPTYSERKRLSDTLFLLTREIPSMTAECAVVLRDAREKGDWDQAIAELLTQVSVGLYCGEGDIMLDGLQQYLLTLGISC